MANMNVAMLRDKPLTAVEQIAKLPGMDRKPASVTVALVKEIVTKQESLADLEHGLAEAISAETLLACMPASKGWLLVNEEGRLEIDIRAYIASTLRCRGGEMWPRDILAEEVSRLMSDNIHGIVTPFIYPSLDKFLLSLEAPNYSATYDGDSREMMLEACDKVFQAGENERKEAVKPLVRMAVSGYIKHNFDAAAFFETAQEVATQLYGEELLHLEPFSYAIEDVAYNQAISRLAAKIVIELDPEIRRAVIDACRARASTKESLASRIARVTG